MWKHLHVSYVDALGVSSVLLQLAKCLGGFLFGGGGGA